MSGNAQRKPGADDQRMLRDALPGEGFVSEMFCSVQGEGPFVGERQIFVRTAGCSVACSWCDTLYSKVQTTRFVIHGEDRRAIPNPMRSQDVLDEVLSFARQNPTVKTVSITGGEPLEQPEFVSFLSRGLCEFGLRVYLETAGIHPEPLKMLLAHIDVIAMDIKLPSSFGRAVWEEHQAFLSVLAGTPFVPGTGASTPQTVFVKIVVDNDSTQGEIETAARLIADLDPGILLVLQPESGALMSHRTPREATVQLLQLLEDVHLVARRFLDDVRVVPQCHKILGLR